MRNFEERMSEIMSRSHARILRRRKQTASACVSLVVVLCLGGTHLWQQQSVYQQENIPVATTTLPLFAGSLTVADGKISYVYSDKETVTSVELLFDSLEQMQSSLTDAAQVNSEHSIKTTSGSQLYTIVLETETGETERYTLLDKVLTKHATQEQFLLSDTQWYQLLELLSLSVE